MRTRRSSADRTAVITTIHTAHNGLSVRLANMTIPRRGAAPWSVASEFATDATVSSKTSARRVGCSGYTRIAPVRSSAGRVFAFVGDQREPQGEPKARRFVPPNAPGPRPRVRVRDEDAQPRLGKRLRHSISIAIGD